MIEDIRKALARIDAPGRFAVRRSVSPGDLLLQVKGVGRVSLPVTAATARKLCAAARPAKYGQKEKTLLDPKVRDTWEIPRSRVQIDKRQWRQTLGPELERIRNDLGMPEGCRLRAELHNLLIYEAGQFFSVHQDSEKSDEMAGTLVVVLPSAVKGGAMVLTQGVEKMTCRGSEKKLTFIAFHADCRHEVRPVKSGHRVVLTYNLMLEGEPRARAVSASQVEALARAVRDHFERPLPAGRRGEAAAMPERLVYLLDHEYTKRSLNWKRLKNGDAVRAAALREVADRLDCGVLLGLADVHEMWSTEPEYFDRHGGWGDEDEDDDEFEDSEDDDPMLADMEDYDIEIDPCPGSEPGARQIAQGIGPDEVCSTLESDDLSPYRSEYEGYMGNYGNTLDRWYHRAAVVMWPRKRTFALRARASAYYAIGEVAKAIGNPDEARKMVEAVLPSWRWTVRAEPRRDLLARTLRVATKIDDGNLADKLLEPFEIEALTAEAVPGLLGLADRYGLDACLQTLLTWENGARPAHHVNERRIRWWSTLPGICRLLWESDVEDGRALARVLTERQAKRVESAWRAACGLHNRKEMDEVIQELTVPVLAMLECAQVVKGEELHAALLDALTSETTCPPLEALVDLLRAARSPKPQRFFDDLNLTHLHRYCLAELAAKLNTPPREASDWSIGTRIRCPCALCKDLSEFLDAGDQTSREWPLAQAKRRHIHGIIDGHGLPVTHVTRRKGSPYVLVLTKTKALFQQDAAERKRWARDLALLEKAEA